ncbi:hypothetical protein EUAN_14860 [Andreesenia angusta]|uniref:Uncharacterized protein n=1 Tax=Andreesenia angusta TaxID=39480 RepID=A0A1S1V615_9FIRM|nr:hypothetical protein [Andreesenia angusta]OHW62038.1 hypothetical protein EUAN_14860 [Andreesenia angusta]
MQKKYNIKTLTPEEFKDLIASADDSVDNQIRVTEEGEIYISTIVGDRDTDGLRFRFETFEAGEGYVGKSAASDDRYLEGMYEDLKQYWYDGSRGLIEMF